MPTLYGLEQIAHSITYDTNLVLEAKKHSATLHKQPAESCIIPKLCPISWAMVDAVFIDRSLSWKYTTFNWKE